MAYDWEVESKKEGGSQAARIPPGEHTLLCSRAIYGKQDGTLFSSRAGDPQVMLVFVDNQQREAAQMFTLSDAAGWTVARLAAAMDPDLPGEMKRRGLHPHDLAEPEVLKYWLMHPTVSGQSDSKGNFFKARVAYTKSRSDPRKEYAEITPIRKEPEAAEDDVPM